MAGTVRYSNTYRVVLTQAILQVQYTCSTARSIQYSTCEDRRGPTRGTGTPYEVPNQGLLQAIAVSQESQAGLSLLTRALSAFRSRAGRVCCPPSVESLITRGERLNIIRVRADGHESVRPPYERHGVAEVHRRGLMRFGAVRGGLSERFRAVVERPIARECCRATASRGPGETLRRRGRRDRERLRERDTIGGRAVTE